MSEKQILEDLKYAIENNDLLSSNLIRMFLINEMHKYNLGASIDDIKLSNESTTVTRLGGYSFATKMLHINYLYYIREASNEKDSNIDLINTCFHELTHASQRELLRNSSIVKSMPTFYINLIECIADFNKDYDKYNKNHDKYIFEYQAIISALFKTIDLLNKLNIDTTEKNKELARKIIKFYKDGCPLSQSRKIVPTNDFFITPDIDEYYKLLFGYELSNKTINNIENIANGNIKTKRIESYI